MSSRKILSPVLRRARLQVHTILDHSSPCVTAIKNKEHLLESSRGEISWRVLGVSTVWAASTSPASNARVACSRGHRGTVRRASARQSGDTTPCVKSLRSSYTGLDLKSISRIIWKWIIHRPCRGTSVIRNSAPLGPYRRRMPRALWRS